MDFKTELVAMVVLAAAAIIVSSVSAFKLGRMSRKKQEEDEELKRDYLRPDRLIPEFIPYKSNLDDPVSGVELGQKQPEQKMGMPERDSKGRFLPTKKAVE